MRPFSRSLTAAAALLAFAGLAAGGSASSRAVDATLDTGQASYALQLADDTELPRASKVRVHGQQLNGNTVAVGRGGLTAAPDSTVVAATTGAKKVLVVLVMFADNSSQPETQAQANGVVFANSNSVAAYY